MHEPFIGTVASISVKFIQLEIDNHTVIGMTQGKLYGQLVQQSTLSIHERL